MILIIVSIITLCACQYKYILYLIDEQGFCEAALLGRGLITCDNIRFV
jgi:hypothetical protein